MIVISSSLVLSGTGEGLDHPSFLWQSIVTPTNIAADHEDAAWPAVNLANPATHLFWLSDDDAEQYLTVTIGSADPIDAVGIAGHNFGTAEIAVSVEADDGDGYVEVVEPFMPGDDAPLLFRFTSASFSSIRVKLAAGSANPRAAVMMVGKLLVSPMSIAAPYTPINMGRVVEAIDGISISGDFLGAVITGEHRAGTIPIQFIDGDWYRENMDAFIAYATRRGAFFFGWQPQSNPTEVGYLRVSSDPVVSIHHDQELFSIALSVIGTA